MRTRRQIAIGVIGLALVAAAALAADMSAKEKKKARSEARKMAKTTLSDLYKLAPGAKKRVHKAAGYAVFSNVGVKILLFGSGKGRGVAVDNRTGDVVYMKMLELQAGLGLGVKKFRLVWVFETREALRRFIDSGWEFGGQASAVAQKDDDGAGLGAAMPVTDDIWLYQIAGDGLALELTAKSTKYFKDDELN